MKKKWPLLLLIPLLLILIALFAVYIFKGPRKIKNESIGREYTFQNIQFDMISSDFKPNQEGYEELVERGVENIITYENTSGNTMIIIKNENRDFFDEIITPIQNPINLIRLEREMLKTKDPETGYQAQKYKIILFEGNDKKAMLHYSINQENKTLRSIDVLIGNEYYTISLIGEELEADAYEIIRTVNIKDYLSNLSIL